MALSPSEAWYEAVTRSNPNIRMLVEIYDGTSTWKAVNASMNSGSDLATTEVGVVAVAPLGIELDPLSRQVSFGEVFVDLHPEFARHIVVGNRLYGQRVNIRLGAAELDETDFVAYALKTQIEEITPRPDGRITLVVRGQLQIAYDVHITTTYFLNKHPLECLYDGAGGGVLELAGCHSFDATSFDDTQAEYDDIEHLLVGRAYTRHIITGTTYRRGDDWSGFDHAANETGGSLAQSICRLLNGHLIETEDGSLSFSRFDASASAADDWTDDDIIPNTIKQEALGQNIVNRIVANFGQDPDGALQQSYIANEAASQSTYGYPGGSDRVRGVELSTMWLGSKARLDSDLEDADSQMILRGEGCHAVSGNRSGLTIDANHPVYFMIDSTGARTGGGIEIVKCTTMVRNTSFNADVTVFEGGDQWTSVGPYCEYLTCTIAREQLGTSFPWNGSHDLFDTYVYDITPLVMLGDEIFERFADGCSVITLDTLISKHPLQIGDLVTLTTDHYVDYGKDGLTTSDKWEIIAKEVDALSPNPSIHWKLAHAFTSAITQTGYGDAFPGVARQAAQQTDNSLVAQLYIAEGMTITQTAGLVGTVAAGKVANGVDSAIFPENRAHTFTASKDTYVYASRNNPPFGGLIYKEAANGGADPGTGPGELLLGKVITDGAGITSIDQTDAPTEPLPGSKVVDESLTAAKVASQTLGTENVNTQVELTRSLIPNPSFSLWTRG